MNEKYHEESYQRISQARSTWIQSNIFALVTVFGVDLLVNSSFDYDDGMNHKSCQVQVLLLGLQIALQFCSFAIWFSIVAETVPFRKGLMDNGTAKLIPILHIIYIIITMSIGGQRVVSFVPHKFFYELF